MNYYQHHIGDFNNATRHLNLIERALYRDLIEMYYDAETAIDGRDFSRLARKLLCRSDEEQQALRFVLGEFFEEDDGLYKQRRCEREIGHYHAQREQQSRAGKASAAKRAAIKQEQRSTQSADLFELSIDNEIDNKEAFAAADSPPEHRATGVVPGTAGAQQGDEPTTNQQPLTTTHITSNQLLGKNKKTRQGENSNAEQQALKQQAENTNMNNPEQWTPALISLNHKLKLAGGEAIDQTTLQQTLVLFNPHYEGQCLSHNKRLAKLVAWIMDKQQRARLLQHSMQQKPTAQVASAYRSSSNKAYSTAAASDEPADSEVYCGQVTYGQLRKAMQAGETYLQCFQRISMQRRA